MGKLLRPSRWFDKNKMQEVFGIKVKIDGNWVDAGDDNGILFFENEADRDIKIEELKEAGFPLVR